MIIVKWGVDIIPREALQIVKWERKGSEQHIDASIAMPAPTDPASKPRAPPMPSAMHFVSRALPVSVTMKISVEMDRVGGP